MTIAVICDVLGKENNGTTIAAMNLIRSLREKGYDVRVVCSDPERAGQKDFYVVPTLNLGPLNAYVAKNGVALANPDRNILTAALNGVDHVHVMMPFALGSAARTVPEWNNVIAWWDRLDANRERRERYHEISRSGDDLPIDYGADENGLCFPDMMNTVLEKQRQNWVFIFSTSFLYYEDYDTIDEDTRNLYRQSMAAFDGNAPSYHIALLDKPTIVWDFHSLLLGIQMMFSFMLTDEKTPLRLCRHCMKVFVASRPSNQFCSPECKNRHNVYKNRAKKKENE